MYTNENKISKNKIPYMYTVRSINTDQEDCINPENIVEFDGNSFEKKTNDNNCNKNEIDIGNVNTNYQSVINFLRNF